MAKWKLSVKDVLRIIDNSDSNSSSSESSNSDSDVDTVPVDLSTAATSARLHCM